MEMARVDRATRTRWQECTADVVTALCMWANRSGAEQDERIEVEQVIRRLIKAIEQGGGYWLLSGRDDQLIGSALGFAALRAEPATRSVYKGGYVSGEGAGAGAQDAAEYFSALGEGQRRRGQPRDIARDERVAEELAAIKREGVPLWREPRPNAGRFRRPLADQVLTDDARIRLEFAYASGSGGVRRDDLLNCIERVNTFASLLAGETDS